MTTDTRTCALTGATIPAEDCFPCSALRPSLLRFIQKQHPGVTTADCIARDALPVLKAAYVEESLADEIGEIGDLERNVIESLKQHDLISARSDESETLATRTIGERLSDRIASFGGSWKFIITFGVFIVVWISSNLIVSGRGSPDPYPFILLNLLLSCLAALQAPVIMMSQNRVEARDRQRAEQDYQVNLKAELEIRHLHEKLDHLLHHHGERLLEIQTIQTELLQQLVDQKEGPAGSRA